jgi:hypothetical protein
MPTAFMLSSAALAPTSSNLVIDMCDFMIRGTFMFEQLQKEFDRLESIVSQKEKNGNSKLNRQMFKIRNTLVILNKFLRLPNYSRLACQN